MRYALLILLAFVFPASAGILPIEYEPTKNWEKAVIEHAMATQMYREAAWGQPGSFWVAVKFPDAFVNNGPAAIDICNYAKEAGAPNGTRIIITVWSLSSEIAGKLWCEVGGKWGLG
ncbi:hypothetical protein [Microbaculum sp. FT89]|uniref:hypothetical protein n=1 Tax=Microbaculum sp. FT89 TaxID=3447298 RepID=UPI003F536BD0